MNTYADRTQEDKSKTSTLSTAQQKVRDKPTFQFVDNRPETIAQRKFQELANNNPKAKYVAQLQAISSSKVIQRQFNTRTDVVFGNLLDDLMVGRAHNAGIQDQTFRDTNQEWSDDGDVGDLYTYHYHLNGYSSVTRTFDTFTATFIPSSGIRYHFEIRDHGDMSWVGAAGSPEGIMSPEAQKWFEKSAKSVFHQLIPGPGWRQQGGVIDTDAISDALK